MWENKATHTMYVKGEIHLLICAQNTSAEMTAGWGGGGLERGFKSYPLCTTLVSFFFKWQLLVFLFKDFIYFVFREGKGERKRGRLISMCSCLSCTPYWGSGPQSRHVPWLGIEPATFRFAGWHSTHWSAQARASVLFSTWTYCLIKRKFESTVLYLS